MRFVGPLLLSLSLLPTLGWAQVTDRSYDRAVDLVARLYLYPDDVDAGALLRGSALQLADEIAWLLVETDGNEVYLRHGDGRPIGSVSVASMETLPDAMRSLELLVVEAGGDLGDVDPRLEVLKGMTRALDRYSRVLAGERLERFDERLKGTLVGIGATLRIVDGMLVLQDMVAAGPAATGGLVAGDVVERIDGVSTVNMPLREATERIRGEEGTVVVLSIRRGAAAPFDVSFVRAEVVIDNVHHEVLEGGIAYLRITHFSQQTDDNLSGALGKLRALGGLDKGVILDLRGNTGGSMKEAARAADHFLKEGMLLRTAGPDGGQVQNLQARMDAVDTGDEPPVPVIVLMDRRTASGSEILAGALLELDRAVLIGTRSYGKGTVQKIYNLDDESRFKLTVAQYLLAGDRSIAAGGIVPDLALADVDLDEDGMHYRGWGPAQTGHPREAVVPIVHEGVGWRGVEGPGDDVTRELARRALLSAEGPSRDEVLTALALVAPRVRAEQEERLVVALRARGYDWDAAPADSDAPDVPVEPVRADVRLVSSPDPADPDRVIVNVTVTNRGTLPLYRAQVELVCDTFWPWSGLAVPLGRLEPGRSVTGRAAVRLAPGVSPREDPIGIRLYADGRDPLWVGEDAVVSRSSDLPRIGVDARLSGDGATRRAEILVHNLSSHPLDDVRVWFQAPGDLEVELIDREAVVDVSPSGTGRIELSVRVGETAPAVLPMLLVVESDAWGTLAEWPVGLPRDGTSARLEPPRVSVGKAPLSAPVGPMPLSFTATDDGTLDHVVVYLDGHKIAWTPGGSGRVEASASVPLEFGVNRITIVGEDEHGLVGSTTVFVRGEAPSAVDAQDE